MFAFIVRRIIQAIVVMMIIGLIGFAVKNNIGDPVRDLLPISASEAERVALRDKLGLNDPFITQYLRFLKQALKGDLGISYFHSKPTIEVIAAKAPATLELVFATALIIVFISLPVGVYSAIFPRSWFSRITMGLSTIGVSVPVFLTAIVFIYIFGVELQWLQSYGRGETVNIFGWERR